MDYGPRKDANKAQNLREVRSGARRLGSRPLYFWFDLSGPCNLACTHCAYRVHGRSSDQDVSAEVYDAVVAELMPAAYLCHVGGTNYGEPTLSRRFHQLVRDCGRYQVGISLTTNGTRMHLGWFDDLIDRLEVIGFSMEGMEAEFERIRGFKWSFFLRNVERVCQARAGRGRTFRVEWRYCAHAGNIHQLPAMIRLASRVGVDRIQVMDLIPFQRGQEFQKLYYHRSLANECFAQARVLARELGVEVNVPPDFAVGSFEPATGPGAPGLPRPRVATVVSSLPRCYRPWQCCAVNELGQVRPDAVYWRRAGSLTTEPFEAIWNGRLYRRLRRTVNRRPDGICTACRMPAFDSDRNASAAQALPGARERLQHLLTLRRRAYAFTEVPLQSLEH
jgi:MoaA/NifB/PqqE/SkfB family radical SAM enzyme